MWRHVISHVAYNLKWKCRKQNYWSGIDGLAKKKKKIQYTFQPFVLQFVFILHEQSGASMRPRSAELWHHIMSFISPFQTFFFFFLSNTLLEKSSEALKIVWFISQIPERLLRPLTAALRLRSSPNFVWSYPQTSKSITGCWCAGGVSKRS